jgi:hypothetical protein
MVLDFLVVCFSVAGIAVAGGRLALRGSGRITAKQDITISAINGSILTLLYGIIPTLTFGIGIETVHYGFPFTVFVQSGVNTFSPLFVVLSYMFWFALVNLTQVILRAAKGRGKES